MSDADIEALIQVDEVARGAGTVWRVNEPAVRAFAFSATQWRTTQLRTETGAKIYWIGLDYAGVRAGLDGLGVPITPDLWAGLMVMENEAQKALNEGS
ncbi:DUF1799 domain-containing protein [Paradevosia shaoguanensis]|uniref:DUF1799 domain-containing protein n=1 Tax=Paradevosia shaoguanensis TaxID=1335043 RepID=A0AA41UI90_9HYPH|nr:DUF1799 domain-containing protein [Paradevosia shaoguanensis]MCF1744618.1 DUF1799 domain-containing protein [Paradevosia shaoguanensis]MCI0129101.1 DUF1799 domain-containing protein [Paradevosia shaoguanensis]